MTLPTHGLDERPVEPNRIRKSIGKETTFSEDIDDTDQMFEILKNIADRLEYSLIKREAKGRTITLKLKYFDTFNVKISNHYFNPPKVITLPLGEFKIIIEQWRTFMSTPTNEPPIEKA
jgi:nucleotidyltransferase/DNA polymerase involved in DNA repair